MQCSLASAGTAASAVRHWRSHWSSSLPEISLSQLVMQFERVQRLHSAAWLPPANPRLNVGLPATPPHSNRRPSLVHGSSRCAKMPPRMVVAERVQGPSDSTAAAGSSTTAWGKRQQAFEERCCQLDLFRQQHGHTRVPINEPSGLGQWVARQRHAWKAGRLLPARQRRLAELGFCTDAFQDSWAARFCQLAHFHSEHGHCQVPYTGWAHRQFPGLYAWLQHQLHQWRQGTLLDDRRRRLEGLGVAFLVQEGSWELHFAQLLQFREEYGHVNVPFQWPGNPELAAWVVAQRRRWRGEHGAHLTPSQHSRLLSCGFKFDPLQERWDRRYVQLCELHRQRGGDLLSAPLPSESGLANWASFQRWQWRQGRLAPERVEKLAALGLHSSAQEDRWQRQVAQLDQLIATLGFPAAYTLLLVAPGSSAEAMAAAAVASRSGTGGGRGRGAAAEEAQHWEAAARSHGSGASSTGPGGSAAETAAAAAAAIDRQRAAAVVRWFRGLRAGTVPQQVMQALAARGLPVDLV